MTAILITLAVVALVVHGLERNHRRRPSFAPRLAGSHDVEDRDLLRLHNDLHGVSSTPTPRVHRSDTASPPVGHRVSHARAA
ncbi:hypothetical protein [Saccharothrix syringae]|uniref:Uncharacterized protein n=1 Tax=Saccharothrix syringae TaxID=103733 RepID=A0A5Q0H8X5_SACSY|nr:hypothetical protein [Saccharothrix syringae]QFZ22666.1 hypothetical protein EKG83_39240 [Saccharothrix syringae]